MKYEKLFIYGLLLFIIIPSIKASFVFDSNNLFTETFNFTNSSDETSINISISNITIDKFENKTFLGYNNTFENSTDPYGEHSFESNAGWGVQPTISSHNDYAFSGTQNASVVYNMSYYGNGSVYLDSPTGAGWRRGNETRGYRNVIAVGYWFDSDIPATQDAINFYTNLSVTRRFAVEVGNDDYVGYYSSTAHAVTNIPRSYGWHRVMVNFTNSSATNATIYYDQNMIYNITASLEFPDPVFYGFGSERGGGAAGRVWTDAFIVYSGFNASQNTTISKGIRNTGGNIKTIKLDAHEYKPANTNIEYFISDDGASWHNITMGDAFTLNGTSDTVRYKYEFGKSSTDVWLSPEVLELNLTTTTVISSETYNTDANETKDAFFILSLDPSFTLTDSNATFNYNNTPYSTNKINHTYFNVSVKPPLVDANATNIQFYWNYSYVRSATRYEKNTTQQNQTVYLAYNIEIVKYNNVTFEHESELVTFNFSYINHSVINYAKVMINYTNFTLPYVNNSAEGYITIPEINNYNTTFNLNTMIGLSFQDKNLTRNYTTSLPLLAYQMVITNCTDFDIKTLNISLWNEEKPEGTSTSQRIVGDIDATFKIWKSNSLNYRNLTISVDNTNRTDVCIYPSNASYFTETVIEYDSIDYVKRFYYLFNKTLTNITQNVSLYLLGTGNETNIFYYVRDETDKPIDNAFITAQRYYPGENVYRTIEIAKTDYDGIGLLRLIPYTTKYKFEIWKNELLKVTEPSEVKSATNYIYINLKKAFLESYDKIKGIITSLSWTNHTTYYTFTGSFNDPNLIMQTGCLYVYKRTTERDERICLNCVDAYSGTLNCIVNSSNPGNYVGNLYVNAPGASFHTLEVIELNIAQILQRFGASGLFFAFLITIVLVAIFSFNPATMVFGGFLGMFMSYILGLISFGQAGIMLTTLIILGGVIMMLMKT